MDSNVWIKCRRTTNHKKAQADRQPGHTFNTNWRYDKRGPKAIEYEQIRFLPYYTPVLLS